MAYFSGDGTGAFRTAAGNTVGHWQRWDLDSGLLMQKLHSFGLQRLRNRLPWWPETVKLGSLPHLHLDKSLNCLEILCFGRPVAPS